MARSLFIPYQAICMNAIYSDAILIPFQNTRLIMRHARLDHNRTTSKHFNVGHWKVHNHDENTKLLSLLFSILSASKNACVITSVLTRSKDHHSPSVYGWLQQ